MGNCYCNCCDETTNPDDNVNRCIEPLGIVCNEKKYSKLIIDALSGVKTQPIGSEEETTKFKYFCLICFQRDSDNGQFELEYEAFKKRLA